MFKALDIAAGGLIFIVLVVGLVLNRRLHPTLNSKYFQTRWLKLQKLCSNKKLWYQAMIDADELLDEALKQRHFKGKTTGERLVSAQHYFSSNDAVWFSHKLTNKVKDNSSKKLNKKETLEALAAFRLALKDLGALRAEKKVKGLKK